MEKILTSEILLEIFQELQKRHKKENAALPMRRQGNMIQYNVTGTKRSEWWTFTLTEVDSNIFISVSYYWGKDKPEMLYHYCIYRYTFQDVSLMKDTLVKDTLVNEIDKKYHMLLQKYDLIKFVYDSFDDEDKRMIKFLMTSK